MDNQDHRKQNTGAILNTIVSANKNLHKKISKQEPTLSTTQVHTVMLIKLGYSSNEIRILLDITDKDIKEITKIVEKFN